jgi:succinate dehydrogenase/fumarate reductase flavoprotein subunit
MPDNHYDAIVIGSGISGGWAAKELTEKGSEDRMDILKALKQLYVRMNLTEKFEAIKKEMQP